MSFVEVVDLTRQFGKLTAVDKLNLSMEKGEVLGLLGPNGAGKTTTIRMLAGIISSTSGYGVIAGRRTDKEVEKLHEVIGLLTETPGLYDRLSARRNLEFFAGFYSEIDINEQVEKYLKLMGLWERREDKAGTFSKGMKQRLALARALLHEPQVLFLDEPTSGLDPAAAEEVRNLIKKLSNEGRTIFLSTHNLTEAELLCNRIAVVKTHLLAIDTPQNLRQHMFRQRVVVKLETLDNKILEVLKRLDFVNGSSNQDNQVTVELSDTEKNLPELVQSIVQAGGRVLGVSEEKHSLEEIYMSLIREEK